MEITIVRIPESDDVTRSRRRTLAVKRLIAVLATCLMYHRIRPIVETKYFGCVA